MRNWVLWLTALAVSGCSSFAVSDHYASSFDETNATRPLNQAVGVEVVPKPDNRFLSLGVLGLPIVPVHVALSSPDEIEIRVTLELRENAGFSLAWHPCLEVEGEDALCAASARVDWLAQHAVTDANGTHYEQVPASVGEGTWARAFTAAADRQLAARVTREDIYARAGYRGEPPAAYQRVDAVYTFPCRETCPASFALDADSLAEVAGTPVTPARIEFRNERQREYDPLYTLQ